MAKKRNYGSGTIVADPADSKAFIGYLRRTIDGKRHKSPVFRGTKRRDVDIQLKNWEAAGGFNKMLSERQPRDRESVYTVGQYLDEWYPRAARNWADTTLGTNRSTFNRWCKEQTFCDLPFAEVKKQDVQDFFSRMPEKTSEGTRSRVHRLLHAAFQDAVDDDRLSKNVVKTSTSPTKPKSKVVEAFHPIHEAALVRSVAGDPYWHSLILVALDTGMRQAEILGLQVREVDFMRGEVRVRRTCDTVERVPVVSEGAKTDGSIRDIRIAPETLEALRSLVVGKGERDHLFTEEGTLWTRTRFYDAWLTKIARAGLPHYKFHSLRHTCATSLLRQGCYLTAVSKRLGHSRPSITLDIYSSFLPADQTPLTLAFSARLKEHSSPKSVEAQEIGTQIGPSEVPTAA